MICVKCRENPGQPRRDHGERVFCDRCASEPGLWPASVYEGLDPEPDPSRALAPAREATPTVTLLAAAVSRNVSVPVPVPVPYLDAEENTKESEERADIEVLLGAYQDGRLYAEPVPRIPLPIWATPSMHAVYVDMALCSALLREAGDDGTVIYAVDWAAKRLGITGKTVSVALRRLRAYQAIHLVRTLAPMGTVPGRPGPRVFAIVSPGEPVGVEGRAEVGRQAEQPEAHLIDDPLMAGAEVAVPDRPLAAARDGADEHEGEVDSGGAAGHGSSPFSGNVDDDDGTPSDGDASSTQGQLVVVAPRSAASQYDPESEWA